MPSHFCLWLFLHISTYLQQSKQLWTAFITCRRGLQDELKREGCEIVEAKNEKTLG